MTDVVILRMGLYLFNASVKCTKELQIQRHVITSHNVKQEVQNSIQSDVVIPNELGNDETCQGLLCRFVHKITNDNEISPHNDMKDKIQIQVQDDTHDRHPEGDNPKDLSTLESRFFALHTRIKRIRLTPYILCLLKYNGCSCFKAISNIMPVRRALVNGEDFSNIIHSK